MTQAIDIRSRRRRCLEAAVNLTAMVAIIALVAVAGFVLSHFVIKYW